MKKFMTIILSITLIVSLLSASSFAIVPGEGSVQQASSLSFGSIQDMFLAYLDSQEIELMVGTEEYYNYICEQVYGETEQSLVDHPFYTIIRSYLVRYIILYREYIYGKATLQNNASAGISLIENFSLDNPCLSFNAETNELRFEVHEDFLKQTLQEISLSNQVMMESAETCFQKTEAQRLSTTSYSASDAIYYASQYVDAKGTTTVIDDEAIYSPEYPNYGPNSNCTNYVSQCLYAGGIAMDRYNAFAGVHSSTTKWYSKKLYYDMGQQYFSVTSSWISASDFYTYMVQKANDYRVVYTIRDLFAYCRPGDVVQLVDKNNHDVHHSVLISGKDNTTAYYYGHSNARANASISRFDTAVDYFIILSFRNTPISADIIIDECGQCADIPDDTYTRLIASGVNRVIECPMHSTHDAEEHINSYGIYCSIHDNIVASYSETEYVCLDD